MPIIIFSLTDTRSVTSVINYVNDKSLLKTEINISNNKYFARNSDPLTISKVYLFAFNYCRAGTKLVSPEKEEAGLSETANRPFR